MAVVVLLVVLLLPQMLMLLEPLQPVGGVFLGTSRFVREAFGPREAPCAVARETAW